VAIPDNASVPLRLEEGRADAVLTDDLEAPHWQRALPATRAIGPLTHDAKAAWFPIDSERLARDFDRWLLDFEASGALAALRARSGLADERAAAPIPALLASLDERLALMPQVARAKNALSLPVTDAGQEARVHDAFRLAVEAAAQELGTEPPGDTDRRRFVDALLRTARFVQERELAVRLPEPAPAADSGPPGAPASASPASTRAEREAARSALDERIRPAIGFVSERIGWLLVAARCEPRTRLAHEAAAESRVEPLPGSAASPCVPPTRTALAQALARHALPAGLEAELHAALARLLSTPREARVRPPPNARRAAPTSRAGSAPRDRAPSA
jgi:hypothetical protein